MTTKVSEAVERLTRVAELLDSTGIRSALEIVYKTHTSLDEEAFESDLRTILSALSEARKSLEPFAEVEGFIPLASLDSDGGEIPAIAPYVKLTVGDFRAARKALGDPDHG